MYKGFTFERKNLAWVAQLVEQGTENPCVGGSIPSPGTINHHWWFFHDTPPYKDRFLRSFLLSKQLFKNFML